MRALLVAVGLSLLSWVAFLLKLPVLFFLGMLSAYAVVAWWLRREIAIHPSLALSPSLGVISGAAMFYAPGARGAANIVLLEASVTAVILAIIPLLIRTAHRTTPKVILAGSIGLAVLGGISLILAMTSNALWALIYPLSMIISHEVLIGMLVTRGRS